MTDTTITETTATEAPAATVKRTPVLMKRDYRKGGKGVTRIYVDPSQIADFEAAGWTRA